MKNLFEPPTVSEVRQRVGRLRPDSRRQWGTMNPAQMLAHCAGFMEMAVGDARPPRMFIGRLIGPMVRRAALRDEKPFPHNSPTAPGLAITDERDFERERDRLSALVDRFAAGGPNACTTHPHTFFGRMTADQWAALMYKHLDHHLRQFGV